MPLPGKGHPKFGGRSKGTPNKLTTTVKDALHQAFQKLGGVERLVAFAEAEPAEFYRIWGRMVPHEVTGEGGGSIVITVTTGVPRSPDSPA